MPNQLAVQPTQRKVSGMSNWFILQPNVVLYKVHTWELHYQVSKYESWFYTRMFSWGEWDLWATWFPQCLAVLTIYQVPGHQQGGKKRGLSSLNIIHWQKKSDLRPGFSQTPHTPDIPAASTSVLQGCRIRLSSWAGSRPQLSSNCCRQRFYYLKTRGSFWTVYIQSCQAESLQLWTVGI